MKREEDFEYQKCRICRYFLPWGNYEKDASAAEVRTGICRRYPPRVDFMFYPYFSKDFRNLMETVAQSESSNEAWIDPETPVGEIVKTCSLRPYVEMDAFCGEYQGLTLTTGFGLFTTFILRLGRKETRKF